MALEPDRPGGWVPKFVILFVVLLAFYLGLSQTLTLYTLVTGLITAIIISIIFARITFDAPPRVTRMLGQLARSFLFVPYLLWEIIKANFAIAYLVIHPDLPIDPRVEKFEAAVSEPISVMLLAISITLTPGTLVVDVRDSEFHVHTLTPESWDELLEGGLERAVRFVFYGRAGWDTPTPRERQTHLSEEKDVL